MPFGIEQKTNTKLAFVFGVCHSSASAWQLQLRILRSNAPLSGGDMAAEPNELLRLKFVEFQRDRRRKLFHITSHVLKKKKKKQTYSTPLRHRTHTRTKVLSNDSARPNRGTRRGGCMWVCVCECVCGMFIFAARKCFDVQKRSSSLWGCISYALVFCRIPRKVRARANTHTRAHAHTLNEFGRKHERAQTRVRS